MSEAELAGSTLFARMGDLFARIDADGNGEVSREEARALRERFGSR